MYCKSNVFRSGDVIEVTLTKKDGKLQKFSGSCIRDTRNSFSLFVREKVVSPYTIIFQKDNPSLVKIEVKHHRKARRNNLFYMTKCVSEKKSRLKSDTKRSIKHITSLRSAPHSA